MKQCEICDITFESGRSYSNHVRWVHLKRNHQTIACKYCQTLIAQCGIVRHEKTCVRNTKTCIFCSKPIKSRTKKFCNSSCAASHNNKKRNINRDYITPEWKEKQRRTTKRNWIENKLVTKNRIFSSKNERAIVAFFKKNFPDDEWKSGGRLKLNEKESLSRDMWSDKLKVCFEYDGAWHFKEIHGQLNRKQTKDKLLEQWCIKSNYRLIRIDEENYTDVQQIINLIYNKTENIIKVGNRY